MKQWNEQGCGTCRKAWEAGKGQDYLASVGEFTRLYRCPSCQAIWEEKERYAHEIAEANARAKYPDAPL